MKGPRFISSPDVHWLEDGSLELDAPLLYVDAAGRLWVVPKGFRTDLASVPRAVPGVLRLFFRGPLQTAWAAILHDWLYRMKEVARRIADAMFYEALRATGESTVGAWMMWLGVRSGGWWAWRS